MPSKQNKKTSKDTQPQGAYVELSALQGLRHLANNYTTNKKLANSAETSGQHRSRALNRGMEFEEVRLYQAGDDVRNIDWRVTARTQATHTKCYRDEKEKPVITLVDQRKSLFFGSQYCFKSVYACELAALINWSTLKRGDRVGGIVLGSHEIHETRPARSQKAVNQWLNLLVTNNHQLNASLTHNEPSLSDSLQQLQRVARSGTECIIISDFYDLNKECEKQLYLLARHNPIKLFWLVDPLEKKLPAAPQLTVSNGKERSVITIGKHQQEQQANLLNGKHKKINDLCIRLGISLVSIDIQKPLSLALVNQTTPRSSIVDGAMK
ncbi:MAG: DUF58 domain-containing protein [Cellvibrionaceae bacterium]